MKTNISILRLLLLSSLLVIYFVNYSFAVTPILESEASIFSIPVDSLILQKNSDDTKQRVIYKGDKVRIWFNDQKLKGHFLKTDGKALYLEVDDGEKKVSMDEIEKIAVYKNKFRRVLGQIFILLGWGSWGFGLLSLIGGIGGLITGELSAILIIAVLPLGLLGFALYGIGRLIQRKKFNLLKRWHILK